MVRRLDPCAFSSHSRAPTSRPYGSHAYDANRNLTSTWPAVINLSWNGENRLASAVKNGVTEYYTYDADGNRIKKVSNGVTTRTFFPGLYEEEQMTVWPYTTTAIKHYSFNGQPIAIRKGTTLSYIHSDHLGSSSVETNSSGSQTAFRSYYAYGAIRASSGTLQTDRTYTGQKQDGTGLLYYNARYYDPALGVFLSPDTLVPDAGRVVDYNRFLYVRGNPLSLNDPSGRCSNFASAGGPSFSECSGGGSAEVLGKAAVTLIAIALTADQQLNGAGTATKPTYVPPFQESVPANPPQRAGVASIPLDGQAAEPFVTTPVQVDTGALVTVPPSTLRSPQELIYTSLQDRSQEIHSQLDPIARSMRTTAVVKSARPDGSLVSLVASSTNALTPAQRQMLGPNEIGVTGSGHAEVKAIDYAISQGWTVLEVAASRPICQACAKRINEVGATPVSPLKQ